LGAGVGNVDGEGDTVVTVVRGPIGSEPSGLELRPVEVFVQMRDRTLTSGGDIANLLLLIRRARCESNSLLQPPVFNPDPTESELWLGPSVLESVPSRS
jgi:hypothetical protein